MGRAAIAALFALALLATLVFGTTRWRSQSEERARHASCAAGAGQGCGPTGDEPCCDTRPVPGGTFLRSYDGADCTDRNHPATVSPFLMERFQITVGRFRAFLDADLGTQTQPPAAGVGAHPRIENSGWDPSWDRFLAADRPALESALACGPAATWRGAPGGQEQHPINCLTFYEAFAFCAAEGGRLPTEAEWNFAAAGGSEQRVYPWSQPPEAREVSAQHAVYARPAPEAVGAHSPAGDARYGHADLSGNVWDWTLDRVQPGWLLPAEGADRCDPRGYPMPCRDCAAIGEAAGSAQVLRGGGFGIPAGGLLASLRRSSAPTDRHHVFGARCVFDLPGSVPPSPEPAVPECAPRCEGRQCGSDGCGGTCGSCRDGGSCGPKGRCLGGLPYPDGPYPFGVGWVIENLQLTGYLDPGDRSRGPEPSSLAALRQRPHGASKPKVLLLQLATLWSDAALEDARALQRRSAELRERRVAVASVLIDGARKGQNCDTIDLHAFIERSGLRSPTFMDPSQRIAALGAPVPSVLAIDVAQMRLLAMYGAGATQDPAFWARIAVPLR